MRRIISGQLQAAGTPVPLDTYVDRIIKYIPADIVAAWIAITGLIAGATGVPKPTVLWVMFAIMTIAAFAWTLKETSVPGRPPAIMQSVLSAVSFVVWVFALGGPFADLPWYHALYGSLALIVATLVFGLIVPKEG